MVENTIGVFTNQFTNKVMREINNSFNNEAPNSTDSVKISGTSISIDKSQFYNYLCLLNQIHQNRKLNHNDIKSIRRFHCYVQDCQVKKFFCEHNFLKIAKFLLKDCSSLLCKNITISIIVELAKEDEYTAKTDIINSIGEDLDIVNFIINYFRNRYIASETFLTHNLLRLFHLIIFTIENCPASPWVTHLKNTRGFFGIFITNVLWCISLPGNILKDIFCMIWKLSEIRFPNSLEPLLSDLFNIQELIDCGLVELIYFRFLCTDDDISITDWTSIEMWLDLVTKLRQPNLFPSQNLNFDSIFKPLWVIINKYFAELTRANAETELENKCKILLRVLRLRVIEKCVILLNTYKDDTIKSVTTQRQMNQMNTFLYNFHSYINQLYSTFYYRKDSSKKPDECTKVRVKSLISNLRTPIETMKTMLDRYFNCRYNLRIKI